MPYLTLWDKISQNLAYLEGNSHEKFKSHRILWSKRHTSHTVVVFTSFLHEKERRQTILEQVQVMFKKISQNFVKSPLKFCLFLQILVHAYDMYAILLSRSFFFFFFFFFCRNYLCTKTTLAIVLWGGVGVFVRVFVLFFFFLLLLFFFFFEYFHFSA